MNLAKVSANGQITLPKEVRQALGVGPGDKVIFNLSANGEMVVENANILALRRAQDAFKGAAQELGINSEDDVQRLVDEVRYKKE